ncbi:MAG: hypothetical protein WCJ71_05790 [Candidatus Omnitrophota bacterium]
MKAYFLPALFCWAETKGLTGKQLLEVLTSMTLSLTQAIKTQEVQEQELNLLTEEDVDAAFKEILK